MAGESALPPAELSRRIESLLREARRLFHLDRADEALKTAEQALALDADSAPALNMHGMILDALGRAEDARGQFERILARDPDNSDAMTNRAITHARAGEFAEALDRYERSLTLNPDQPHAVYNRAVVRMALGDWTRGLAEFESRWRIFPHEAARLTRLAPPWRGCEDIAGKTVLLHHEQGYGDTLQFSRYVPLVAARGARVILAVPAGLRSLMSTLAGSPAIVSEGAPIPAHDYHCALMSLPLAFGTTPSTVPAAIPYLHADPQARAAWRARLGPARRPRIGLCWTGRRYPPVNAPRDMALQTLLPMLSLDADFVCLQTELSEHERALLSGHENVSCHGEGLKDFADTAALVDNLDLVVTVDTAVAHLAGALGKTVWLMNRFATCWRWLQSRADSPWYPSLRLYRQPRLGDWASVVDDVAAAARKFIGEYAASRQKRRVGSGKDSLRPARRLNNPARKQLPRESRPAPLARMQAALALHQQGRLAEAIAGYREVLAEHPVLPEASHYLGIALAQRGDCEAAIAPLARAIEANPRDASAHDHLGNALAGLERHEEALASYERALALDPRLANAYYNRAITLAALGREGEAIASLETSLALNPRHAEAHNNLGNLHAERRRLTDALASYERALEVQPGFLDAQVNRANLLRRLHRYEEALAVCDQALRQAPQHAEAHACRGAILADAGSTDEAYSSYRQALDLRPNLSEAAWNLGLLHLSRGEYAAGWKLYESRWNVKSLRLTRNHDLARLWTGQEPVNGRTVLLHAEQGYGDTIQFARYAPMLAARGARVILRVPTALQAVMRSLPGPVQVIGREDSPDFDFHCSLPSLPHAFGTELASIPAHVPYLHPDPALRAAWSARMGPRRLPRIGIVWAGRASHRNDFHRSIELRQLARLVEGEFEWISLQKEIRAEDESVLGNLSGNTGACGPAVTDGARVARGFSAGLWRVGEQLGDFADTAALVAELDLVISVDTAVAHLAGAMGKPVWILLPFVADWRWLQGRRDCPWYPSARLYRQTAIGDWAGPLARVRDDMGKFPVRGVQASPYLAK